MSSNYLDEQDKIEQFNSLVSIFYQNLYYDTNSEIVLRNSINFVNTNENSFSLFSLFKLDSICVDNYNVSFGNEFFNKYVDDYSLRFNDAIRTVNHLQTSLKQRDNLYYTDLLKTGGYNPKNFDEFGLLLDPARKFMNEQKMIYDERFEYELIDLSPAQKDNLDLLLELRKRIITKAEDLYLGEQFEYMERGLINRDLEKIEPFNNYKKLKEESLIDAGCLIAMARDGHLFLKDLNQPYDRPKLISREELLNTKMDSPILDHDNYELIDQNGKAVDPKLIRNFEKNLKYLKEDLLNLELTTGNRINPKRKKLTLG